ncbi:Peptidoglycan binding-like [uncultured Caudovirales phage]|uniref:Peptidoglycan binding-like n=1 Tax=uncultured Caudovirales phage TaxID=2100421 RepID=A0A6J5N6B3_9CAUD|nr:Peptidoglycan binding-like [uncultured Caudovirales phage]
MTTWIRPVDGGSISDTFDGHKNRAKPALNPGIDYAVGTGTPVKAVADGTVIGIVNTFTGSGGMMIFLSFPSGHTADYLHLSRIDVQLGQVVKQGQVIGLSGGSGLGSMTGYGAHLHFSFRVGGKPTMGAGNIDYEAFRGAPTSAMPSKPATPAKPSVAPAKGSRAYRGKELRQGEPAGPDVLYLQNKLGVNPPGPFGPLTHAAVVAFQKKHGLLADGIVGPLTWSKLG